MSSFMVGFNIKQVKSNTLFLEYLLHLSTKVSQAVSNSWLGWILLTSKNNNDINTKINIKNTSNFNTWLDVGDKFDRNSSTYKRNINTIIFIYTNDIIIPVHSIEKD